MKKLFFIPLLLSILFLTETAYSISFHASSQTEVNESLENIIFVDLLKDQILQFENYTLIFRIDEEKLAITINRENHHSAYFINLYQLLENRFFYLVDSNGNKKIIYIKNSPEELKKLTETQHIEERYIIELDEEPILLKKIKLEREFGVRDERNLQVLSSHSELIKIRRIIQQKLEKHEEHLVKIREEVKSEIASLLGKSPRDFVKKEFTHVFTGMAVTLPQEAIDKVENLPYVRKVWKDKKVVALLTESVPLINATQLWELGFTGKGIKIAIVDTGIDYTHPDLGNCFGQGCKVIGGWDIVNNDSDPIDDNGHGTHCAGIAAANGSLKGVAPDANLLAYKVLNAFGSGYMLWVIEGIERAVEDGADIISLSLGGLGDPDDPVSKAVDTAVESGVVVVVAAGNAGDYQTIGSPGTSRKAITIGATDKYDGIAGFSSRGPVVWGNEAIIKPEVVAPGVYINSTVLNMGYEAWSGTSMATPHVAGAAALLLEANPNLTSERIKSVLMVSSKDLGYDVWTQGAGRIDVIEAFNAELVTYPQAINFDLVSETIISAELVIENLKGYTLSLNLTPRNVTSIEGIKYDVASLNATTLEILPGENASVLLTIDTSGMEGYFYGYITLTSNTDVYRVPYAFIKLPKLTVIVGNDTFYPIIIAIHNEDISFEDVVIQPFDFSGNNYTFLVPSGNYTIYAFGDDNNFTLNYVLIGQVEVPVESEVTIILNLTAAHPFTVQAESFDGTSLNLFDWGWSVYSNYTEAIINELHQPIDSDGITEPVTISLLKPPVVEGSEVIIYYNNLTGIGTELERGINYTIDYYGGLVDIFNVPDYNSTAGDYFLINYTYWGAMQLNFFL